MRNGQFYDKLSDLHDSLYHIKIVLLIGRLYLLVIV